VVRDPGAKWSALRNRPDYVYVADSSALRAGMDPRRREITFHGVNTAEQSEFQRQALHETAHALETINARMLWRSLDHINARTKGKAYVKLKDINPRAAFEDWEQTRSNKFYTPYMAKDYSGHASELTTVAVEQLRDFSQACHFVENDSDSFRFLLGQLADQ